MDTKKKSLIKTISWRAIAIVISFVITYLFTRSSSMSFEIVIIANAVSMIGYYFHERIWSKYN